MLDSNVFFSLCYFYPQLVYSRRLNLIIVSDNYQTRPGCIEKGVNAPLLSKKGVHAKFTIPKLPTKFSFGISMVNTGKMPTNTNQKYQIYIKL
jgi:hypothetical protein